MWLALPSATSTYNQIQQPWTRGWWGHWEKRLFPFVARLGPAGSCCIQWTWVSQLLGKIFPKILGMQLPGYHTDPHVALDYWGYPAF